MRSGRERAMYDVERCGAVRADAEPAFGLRLLFDYEQAGSR